MATEHRTLAHFALFRSLCEEEIGRLDAQCLWRSYEPGSVILEYEQESTDVYFIARGLVRVWLPSTRRTDVTLSDIGVGEFFGELAAIDARPRSASVTALTAATVARMPASTFGTTVRQHPDVCDQILQLLATRIRVLDTRVAELSSSSVRHRIRAELLRLGRLRTDRPNQAIISPPPTHAEFAARISTHREAVTREFKALERAGMLERHRGALTIVDVTSLTVWLEREALTAN